MACPQRPATALLAQELWDCVIDNVEQPSVSYCYLDLRTCSLSRCGLFWKRSRSGLAPLAKTHGHAIHLRRLVSLTGYLILRISSLDFTRNDHLSIGEDLESSETLERVSLRKLHLFEVKSAGAWFARPDCPFNLSRLIIAHITYSMSANLGKALWNARALKHLTLNTALVHLEVVWFELETLAHIVTLLSAVADNNFIEEINLEIIYFLQGSQELVCEFDDIMAYPHMPALRIVTLTIEAYESTPGHIHNPTPPTDAVAREDVLQSFPKLREKLKGGFIVDILNMG
ncbi:hypothetical protein B0H19DRAFT_1310758 [Mycena capillaripes]|nr:hypothetical protein B0H19DRAFT_1310758 [Mycena capillaripes]